MNFIAIDVETANPDLSSICQIGPVTFENVSVANTWETYVDPQDYFDPVNVQVHGISEKTVTGAPTFDNVFGDLQGLMSGRVVVCHTHFDRSALLKAAERHSLPQVDCVWLDSAKVVRRAWEQFAQKGYGLKNIASHLGINFGHHDAKEDARAAGEVVLKAIAETGLALDDWVLRVKQPISGSSGSGTVACSGNPEGPLAGEVVVFTGALSLSRRHAADLAARAGCQVSPSVKKSTTLLIVGDQDIRRLSGREKSSKHRKTEELIQKGQEIRILTEGDFLSLIQEHA